MSCNSHCALVQPLAHVLTLVAAPAPGSAFSGWRGACYGNGPICAIAAPADTRVAARFVSTGQLQMTVGGPGVVSSAPSGLSCGTASDLCDQTFPYGKTVELTPAPAQGAQFAGWGGECAQFGTLPCTVQVGRATGATATFRSLTPASGKQTLTVMHPHVSVLSAPAVLGSCGGVDPCTGSVQSGTSVTLAGGGPYVGGTPLVTPPSVTWGGACVGNWPLCSLVVESPTSVSVRQTTTLQLAAPTSRAATGLDYFSATVAGAGRIHIRGHQLPCPQKCEWRLADRAVAKLVASKTRHRARFLGWRGFCSGRHTTCLLKVGPGESATAVFSG
jgi:hypothetical protein